MTINVAAIKRVRGLVGVDLYGLVANDLVPLGKLLSDPVQLADVLYCLCKDEADAKQISDEDFGRALAGDAITLAAEAFVEELFDFFPDARTRANLRHLVKIAQKIQSNLIDRTTKLLEQIDPETEAQKLIASFGSSPGSSGSTPGPSPSQSS